jgi:hypothetical protein
MKTLKSILIINSIVVSSIIPILLLFFFDPVSNSDRFKLFIRCKTCEVAKKLAIEDFNSGKFQVVSWGLLDSDPSARDAALMKTFHIKMIHGGCVPAKEMDCYREQMIKLLYEKFGNQIFPL